MKTIGSFEAKSHLSGLLRDVEVNRAEYLIRRRNQNIACLVPCNRVEPRKKTAESSPLGLPEHIWWSARFKTAEETDLWCGIYLGLSMANFRSAGMGRRCPFVQYAWL